MGVTSDTKRIVVMTTSVILLVLSVISLWWGGGVIHIILCVLVILASIFGFVGAIQRRSTYLQWFEWVCWALFIYAIVTLIVHGVQNVPVRTWGWDIALTILLAFSAGFAHDLHRSADWST